MSQKLCNRNFDGADHPPFAPPEIKLFQRLRLYSLKYVFLLPAAAVLAAAFFLSPAHAYKMPEKEDLIEKFGLQTCNDKTLAVEFLCNPQWEFHVSEHALLVVISKEPLVTATFARLDAEINYLYQLDKTELTKRNLYTKGFKADLRKVNGQDAMVVRAFSRSEPQRRVLDFFYIHQGELFGALFAVHPIDSWDEYKFLIKTISESIRLLPEAEDQTAA